MRRSLVTAAALLATLLSTQAVAAHGSPTMDLRTSEGTQAGELVFSEWIERAGELCVLSSGDGTGTFPAQGLVVGESGARVVLDTSRKPKRVEVSAWREIDEKGQPVGEPEQLEVELNPRIAANGRVKRWRAQFDASPAPDSYLRVYARWRDRCGAPRHMLRTFHLSAPGEG